LNKTSDNAILETSLNSFEDRLENVRKNRQVNVHLGGYGYSDTSSPHEKWQTASNRALGNAFGHDYRAPGKYDHT